MPSDSLFETLNPRFIQGLTQLGFVEEDNCLFLTDNYENSDPLIRFELEKAYKDFGATAVYFTKQLAGNNYKPQVFIYDYTNQDYITESSENIIKKVWSSGKAPLACVFYKTEIKVLNCTRLVIEKNGEYSPNYLIDDISNFSITEKEYVKRYFTNVGKNYP